MSNINNDILHISHLKIPINSKKKSLHYCQHNRKKAGEVRNWFIIKTCYNGAHLPTVERAPPATQTSIDMAGLLTVLETLFGEINIPAPTMVPTIIQTPEKYNPLL